MRRCHRASTRTRASARSLIYGLANVRAGFWWDSGIEDGDRLGERIATVPRRFGRWAMRRLRAQSCLLAEFTGRFAGPFQRYWYLSDGGFGDSLGVYELVRRQVPIIICADATRDVDGGQAALTNAIRRVRVDFRAEIRFLSRPNSRNFLRRRSTYRRRTGVPQSVLDAIGTLDDLPILRGVTQPQACGNRARQLPRRQTAQSVLLYVKASTHW